MAKGIVLLVCFALCIANVAALGDCTSYCQTLMENCNGAGAAAFPFSVGNSATNATKIAVCERVCAVYPTDGLDGDTGGNTLQCREYHAGVAASDPDFHCNHAGPSGGGACGTTCEAYCNVMSASGPMDYYGFAVYSDVSTCASVCATFFDADDVQTNPATVTGNNAICRQYHATAALEAMGNEFHYNHSLSVPTAFCVSDTNEMAKANIYCDRIMATCPLHFPVASGGRARCLATAELLWSSKVGDSYGDDIECRVYNAMTSCEDAGIISLNALCGDARNLCPFVQAACTSDSQQYSSIEECDEYIAASIFPAGVDDATLGNSLSCRAYHASVAYYYGTTGDSSSYAAHCMHAGPTGAGVCTNTTISAMMGECQIYCAAQLQACGYGTPTGIVQYNDRESCMRICMTFPTNGEWGFQTSAADTLECRMYHTGVALSGTDSLTNHCEHGGPSGGGLCGILCESYCRNIQEFCTGTNMQYNTEAECLAVCDTFLTTGAWGITNGNSLQCRIYHVDAAILLNTPAMYEYHCPHAGIASATCQTDNFCDGYCEVMDVACPTQYGTIAMCQQICPTFPEGAITDRLVDSVGCRAYHASVAIDTSASLHCPHAGPWGSNSTGGCGTACEAFCDFNIATCTGTYTQYASKAACLASCARWEEGTLDIPNILDDATVNTLACRAYHTSAAITSADYAYHCPHASISGGGACGTRAEAFCDLVMSACTGTNQQYLSTAECLAVAMAMEAAAPGSAGATSDNTLECRIYHANVALMGDADDKFTHCPHTAVASVTCQSGNGKCDGFCLLASADTDAEICTSSTHEAYTTTTACLSACADFEVGMSAFETSGDTLSCREYHLRVAASSSTTQRAFHCGHVQAAPLDNTCVGSAQWDCYSFCNIAMELCGGAPMQPYASTAECFKYCSALKVSSPGDLSVNTVQTDDTLGCRAYHLGVAISNPPTTTYHCNHTGTQTNGQCGTYCSNMCTTIGLACPTDEPTLIQYADHDGCVASCGAMVLGTTITGDTQMCRNYHANVAFFSEDTSYPLAHCKHTGLLGGGVCGDYCTSYCRQIATTCGDYEFYGPSNVGCMAVCNGWTSDLLGDVSTYIIDDRTTNTLACRAYHADAALVNATIHCPHASPLGGGYCPGGGLIANIPSAFYQAFCGFMDGSSDVGFCTGTNEQYATASACVSAAMTWKLGTLNPIDTRGNSFACRAYHAGVAALVPVTHCPHAGPTGGDAYGCISQCIAFCASQNTVCGFGDATVAKAQFADQAECLAVCETWTVGALLVDGNQVPTAANSGYPTSACREYHLAAASGSTTLATAHCKHTGYTDPDNQCRLADSTYPSNCYAFCDVVMAACYANVQYTSYGACLAECNDFDHTAGARGDTDGDSYNCRMYHAIYALQHPTDRSVHCPHVKASSSVCVAASLTCVDFCDMAMTTCTGLNVQFASTAKCLTRCASWTIGTIADRLMNTLGCRQYHLNVAASDTNLLSQHCPHIGMADSQSQCGSRCDAFCALAIATCTSTFGTVPYASLSACTTACANFATTGNSGDSSGNTFQCREYYLGVAADATTDVSTKKTDNCPLIKEVSTSCSVSMVSSSTGMSSSTAGNLGGNSASALQVSVALLVALIAALIAVLA